jgi:hypothetical protein
MDMGWLLDTGSLALAFVAGLLAPAAGNAVNALVSSRLGRSERRRDQADARSRQAAEACYEELAKLVDLIPAYAAVDRRTSSSRASDADYEALKLRRQEHNASIATLESHTVLLRPAVRTEMEALLSIIRYAYDLPYRSNPGTQIDQGWHPDNARSIAVNLVQHARDVLATHLTDAPLPTRPDAVQEYALAVEDRNEDLGDYFSDHIEEDDKAVQDWRSRHGLPPMRRPLSQYRN